MTEPLSLLTALLLGLFGSSHCLVMCGGIAAALSSQNRQQPLASMLLFNLGRISSYSLGGLLVGTLGLWLQSLNDLLMLGLRTLAAFLLILMGLYIGRWGNWLTRIEQVGQFLWKRLQPATGKLMSQSSLLSRFRLGLLWGWLPCGLIYSTLTWVAANGEPLKGALTMFCFGLGTLPALFAAQLAASSLMQLLNRNITRTVAGLLLISYGIWTAIALWLP
jgi:uncharacterized protein